MMVPFILMTIAFVIMLIVALIQQRTNKRLTNRLEELETEGWRKVHGFGRLVSIRRRFIVIKNAGDNATLNRTVEKYKENGYEYDSQNSTDRLEEMILRPDPWIEFSMNPIIPWCFGNCAVETGSSDLRRIIKGGPVPTHKIDIVHALEDALHGFDITEGRVSE